ncbi:MAG TPA: serine/threonine-protein kinase [Candidatus Acidoferrum sp.]|nr:serine/threonine-protein kinase [Candidatus Acidoferrum sp.]
MDDHRGNERFGRYEILAELGRGAMGVVYKARDPKINRVVAVKTVALGGQSPEDELEYRERFVREAEAAGRLSHPGIVTIFDVGEEPETRAPYIVMEYVSGPSLEKLLSGENHTLPLERALQLTLELAEALDCAHSQGVVHRDLKPANILITEEGHAKIADFGIAKLNLANLTLAGRALGTPAYMSPEQLSGEEVDGRSDLFSLGVILYTVLTGYRPFQGNSALTVSFKVVNRDPVPASILDTELPPGLDYIIARAMAKDPAQRYQRGMEMVLDIQELREGREPWSKTKQPGSFAGSDAVQTASLRAKAWATGQRAVTSKAPIGNRPALALSRDALENLLNKMRQKSFAGAMLLLGLIVFGLQLRPLIWPEKVATRYTATESLPLEAQAASGKEANAVIEPRAAAATPAAPAPAPVVKKLTRRAAAGGSAAQVKVARAVPPADHPSVSPISPASPVHPASPAMLDIEVEHKFAEAHLSIWVDDRLTYTHLLEGADKKHLVVFHKVQGHEFHAMQIPPGKHLLRVQVTADADPSERSATIDGEFASGTEKMLRVVFSKSGEMKLSLE